MLRSSRRPLADVVSLVLSTPLLLLVPATSVAAARVAKPYDFDGDGFPELVVGAPNLQVGSFMGAGGISVLPASKKGVAAAGHELSAPGRSWLARGRQCDVGAQVGSCASPWCLRLTPLHRNFFPGGAYEDQAAMRRAAGEGTVVPS